MDKPVDDWTMAAASALSGPKAVAVTPWTARLADPECERNYRIHRFPEDRRRALTLMCLVAFAGVLNLLVELDAYTSGLSRAAVLVPPVVGIFFPLIGLGIVLHVRTPLMLETLLAVSAAFGMTMRLSMLTLHPGLVGMWPIMMIGIVFAIYLYLPLRFTVAVACAAAFSIIAPIWWSLSQGGALPADQFQRGLVWLLMANALGGTAANSLHRSQRAAFAQSLVLQKLLSTDSLTGIANRRSFDAALEREWRRCRRAGTPLSLLMIDVDHFKAYNDHWGHQEGDGCLRLVARLMVESAGRPGDLAARYGGEEFVCLLPEVGLAGAHAVAARLVAALESADIDHPRSPTASRLTLSIGVATACDLSGESVALVALADKLLYAAKGGGRDRIVIGELGELSEAHAPAATPAIAQAA
jgi:diguanylate cyclase (GGDEF)-like protein